MSTGSKIDSNVTGLRYAQETIGSLGVLPGSPTWLPLSPNSYADFGGEISTIPSNPINAGRQNNKGTVSDLDASGGFNTDLSVTNIQDLLQGFMFASHRPKGEETTTEFQATGSLILMAETAGFLVGDLVFIAGAVNAANNGLHRVTAVTLDTSIAVADSSLVDETVAATVVNVGHQFSADELIAVNGTPGSYTAATKDLTELGLIPGEWIFVGGDTTSDQFSTAANNGFKRVKLVTANTLTIDKSDLSLANETTTSGETLRIFYGRVLKNESDPSLQLCRSYQIERTLGNDGVGASDQAEYLVGSVPNEASFNISTADKVTADLSFVSTDVETRTSTEGPKGGTRPALVGADILNTTSDFSRIRMALVSATEEAPTPLFAFLTEMTINISNGVTPAKAVGTLGSIGVSTSNFTVNGQLTAYFQNVTATQAVRNNSDITLDFTIAKANTGITVDIPLITLGDARANVSQNEPITLPLSLDAATGAKVDANMDHTLLMVFWDYLPTAAG